VSKLATPAARRLSTWTTASYGFGSVAYGVKDAGFGTFLLIFYNQVVGLDASTVGLVIFIALVCDAFVDPLIGVLSDRTRGRWGRRHPWMYSAALPIAIGWLLLWNPPHISSGATLVWLFLTAVVVRSAVSCYEVPSQALTPELTSDYDERTRITSYRYLFGWAGGLSILLLAYGVFLTPSAAYPNGLLNRVGYGHLAIASAVIMVVAILASAFGTHHEIARLPKTVVRSQTLGAHFRELWETVKNRGFLILMLAGICAYTNQGISYALSNYTYSYVWLFKSWTLQLLPFALMLGAALAFVIAPAVGKRTSKPHAAMAFVLAAAVFQTMPYWLRFAGVVPQPGSSALVFLLLPIFVIATALSVSSFILGASMMADVVEDSEARTGRRSEGVYFAGSFFVQKCTSGLGIMIVGQLLDLVSFPKGAKPGMVPVAVIDHLTLAFILIYGSLAVVAAILFSKFPFGRTEHEARLARMIAAAEAEGAPYSP
jgi:GPH family glycoside/pentoside/hexuronide:cation symporter